MKNLCPQCTTELKPGKALCPACGFWNLHLGTSSAIDTSDSSKLLSTVQSAEKDRIKTGPWDECWGGGIVKTSATLLGALPGAGKSTLSLQIAGKFCTDSKRECIYIASEEALEEVKLRADRLKIPSQELIRMIPAMGGVANIGEILLTRKPGMIILDSLQGLVGESQADSIEALAIIKKTSVLLKAPSLVINHVTKDGDYAGLMTLQHNVDTLLTLTPEEDDGLRELFVKKNRYGRAFISQFFEMTELGLSYVPINESEENDEYEE